MNLVSILRSFHHLTLDGVIVCSVCTLDGVFRTGEGVRETEGELFEYYKNKIETK